MKHSSEVQIKTAFNSYETGQLNNTKIAICCTVSISLLLTCVNDRLITLLSQNAIWCIMLTLFWSTAVTSKNTIVLEMKFEQKQNNIRNILKVPPVREDSWKVIPQEQRFTKIKIHWTKHLLRIRVRIRTRVG